MVPAMVGVVVVVVGRVGRADMVQGYIHTPDDGRGARVVFIDGAEIHDIAYANTKSGVVLQYKRNMDGEFILNKSGTGILKRWLHGDVVVKEMVTYNAEIVFRGQSQ